MKYQNLKSFEKHLASAHPNHFCRCYCVLLADDAGRGEILRSVAHTLSPAGPIQQMSGSQTPLKAVFEALQTPWLFGEEPLILLDECDKLNKEATTSLSTFLKQPLQVGFLLLGARGKTPLAKVAETLGVVLDLSEEKPWEKEKRLSESLVEQAKQAGKKLDPDVIPCLIERVGPESALLKQELDKLICYVGDRETMERSDLSHIAAMSRSSTIWQTAEGIIWEGIIAQNGEGFYALIPALRSQLVLGLKIASLVEGKVPQEEWSQSLPKLWPRTLEKRKEQATRKGSLFFQKGLDKLFQIELLSRSTSNREEALLTLFHTTLYAAR